VLPQHKKELEQVVGMYFRMGLVQMPGNRVYWENDRYYKPVPEVISRNRFQLLLRSIHFVDNFCISDDQKKDKLWKIRPWLDKLQQNCQAVVPEEHNSVDEMMVAYKGRTSSIKQYIRAKPHPWGFKILARTTATGILCDFDVYQKGDGNRSELGQGADVVLQLTNLQFYSLPYQLMNATKFLLTTFLQVCR